MSPKPGREPVEGWREIGPEYYRLGLAYGPSLIVQSDEPGEWWLLVGNEHRGPFTLKEAQLFAEDHAFQQLLEAAAQLKPQHRAALERLEKAK